MDSNNFPPTPDKFAQIILNCFPGPTSFAGKAESEQRFAQERFIRGVHHEFFQLFHLVQTGNRRVFCWNMARFVLVTLAPCFQDAHPYLFNAVCKIMNAATLKLQSNQDELSLQTIGKFYDLVSLQIDPNHLANFLIDNWW